MLRMGDFEVDTRLEGGGGRYRARLSPDWEIWGPNGGYVAAIALRAAGLESSIPRPVSFAGHFLSAARFDEVDVTVQPVRVGRRAESWRVSLAQGGRTFFEALVRTAAEAAGYEHDASPAPEVPGPDDLDEPGDWSHAFWGNLDRRVVKPGPDAAEDRALPPHWISWHRFRPRATFDDAFVDAGRSLLLIDTLGWPAASLAHTGSEYIAPSLDVTAWFHRLAPGEEWLMVEHRGPVAEGGLMGVSGEVRDRAGRLLASGGSQLLCVPRPADD
jgi:acyl-CoA thioesterase-2